MEETRFSSHSDNITCQAMRLKTLMSADFRLNQKNENIHENVQSNLQWKWPIFTTWRLFRSFPVENSPLCWNRITNTDQHIYTQQRQKEGEVKMNYSFDTVATNLLQTLSFFSRVCVLGSSSSTVVHVLSSRSTSFSHAFRLPGFRWPGPPASGGWNYWSGWEWNGDKACEAGPWQSLSDAAPWGRWRAATCFSLAAMLLALRAWLHVS